MAQRPGSRTAASRISMSFSPRADDGITAFIVEGGGSRCLGAHRHHRAAPDGDGEVQGLEGGADRRGGAGLQAGDAQPGRLSHHGGGRGARLRAARAGRIAGACQEPEDVRRAPRRPADDAGQACRHGDRHRGRGALLAYRSAWKKDTTQGKNNQRSRDGEDVRHRNRAVGGRRRGADLRRPGREERPSRSSACTARCGRCASTRARPRCRR